LFSPGNDRHDWTFCCAFLESDAILTFHNQAAMEFAVTARCCVCQG
jgi:hypothetical protein